MSVHRIPQPKRSEGVLGRVWAKARILEVSESEVPSTGGRGSPVLRRERSLPKCRLRGVAVWYL